MECGRDDTSGVPGRNSIGCLGGDAPAVRKARAAPGGAAGLSLVELILALGILAFAITATLQVSVSLLENGSVSRHRTEAVLDAQTVLDDMRALRDTGVAVPADLVEAYPAGPLEFEFASLPGEEITVAYGDTSSAPLTVSVTVRWTDMRGRPMEETLTTIIDRS